MLTVGYHVNKDGRRFEHALDHCFTTVRQILPDVRPAAAMFISGPLHANILVRGEETMAGISACVDKWDGARVLWHSAYVGGDIAAEIAVCEKMSGRHDLNVHVNSIASAAAVATAGASRRSAPILFLEPISKKNPDFADPLALNTIFDSGGRVGLCLDTAHIWAAGADISSYSDCMRFFDDIRKDIPASVHLDDSTRKRGSGRDEHAMLGCGEIWGNCSQRESPGYTAVIDWARSRDATVILERTGDDYESAVREDLPRILRTMRR